MKASKAAALACLIGGPKLVLSAINIDGKHASSPATVGDDSPAPISDPSSFDPNRYDCPLPCKDYGNVHSWTPYTSRERLNRCHDPLLLQFSLLQPVDAPSGSLIRACSLESSQSSFTAHGREAASEPKVLNPKKDQHKLYEGSPLSHAAACVVPGIETTSNLQLATVAGTGKASASDTAHLFEQVQPFFEAKDNCNENVVFAYHNNVTLGIFIGPGLGKETVKHSIDAFITKLPSLDSSALSQISAELCGGKRNSDRTFGITASTTGDLGAVQQMVAAWSQGKCARSIKHKAAGTVPKVKIMDIAGVANGTKSSNSTLASRLVKRFTTANLFSKDEVPAGSNLVARDTCKNIPVEQGDSCYSLAKKCGISEPAIEHYNSYKSNFCNTLQPGQRVCCSSGDPYQPTKPKPGADGICATHLIAGGDTCQSLGVRFGLAVDEIEKFNKGKTWAWTDCGHMLAGYNLCLSEGYPPLPPSQEGTQCGPLVPGTQPPTDRNIKMADLNPCPLKACCSNWGFCGVFPAHCDIHAPEGGGPGSKKPEFQNTCVSNCGNEIKKNSEPPSSFQRVGYYEAFSIERDCLLLHAKDANTDGSFTHIHYAFGTIDDKEWKPVVNKSTGQWKEFKELTGVKRILSLGGWAYSTEPATFNIIRQAIINNRDTFAKNLAKFVSDEGIDGIDLDWEYPGAPDILVDGKPIGEKGDGIAYLKFLITLKKEMGDKSVSIAAPASYWYLQAFPIERIAKAIDYIVYMTYDLHGQWDYGNPNAFDMCPSGKCIRSHVNLTETRNSLSMITKAGVPNNKIMVGEASYGRSFHMAKDGCWGPMCDFTGSRTKSDANPGRCTKTAGYLGYAEINEIVLGGDSVRIFHDGNSNSDIMLYKGDYISYMTETTKSTRRADWKNLNFAGTIDWAVDLQAFSSADFEKMPDIPKAGEEGCVGGIGLSSDSGELCEMACHFGFCPESACICDEYGPVNALPPETNVKAYAKDPFDAELNRLCNFVCKYGTCPESLCEKETGNNDPVQADPNEHDNARKPNGKCPVVLNGEYRDISLKFCEDFCKPITDAAQNEGRSTNYGCVGFIPLGQKPQLVECPPIPSSVEVVAGECSCDNPLVNFFADTVIEALAIIAEIGCLIIMSTIKLVVKAGLALFPEVGKPIDAGLDAVTSAAQMIKEVYPDSEDPVGAFDFWLSPCGDLSLVPEDIRKAFDILNQVSDAFGSFKAPKGTKGTGRKGDSNNPRSPIRNPPPKRPQPTGGTGGNKGNNGGISKGCKANQDIGHYRQNHNTLDHVHCDARQNRVTDRYVITSVDYANAHDKMTVKATCKAKWAQACYHYSSVIQNNPKWSTMTCPPAAGTTAKERDGGPATDVWLAEHIHPSWIGAPGQGLREKCDKDEYPPAYLFESADPDFVQGGQRADAQLVRFLPKGQNRGAGSMWRRACLNGPLDEEAEGTLVKRIKQLPAVKRNVAVIAKKKNTVTQTQAAVTVDHKPYFMIDKWEQPPHTNDGLEANTVCWPKAKASDDPGFALLRVDRYNRAHGGPKHDYTKPYQKGSNGT